MRIRFIKIALVCALLLVLGFAAVLVLLVRAAHYESAEVAHMRVQAAEIIREYEQRFEVKDGQSPLKAPLLFDALKALFENIRGQDRYRPVFDVVDSRKPWEWTDDDFLLVNEMIEEQSGLVDGIRLLATLDEPPYRVDLSHEFQFNASDAPGRLCRMGNLLAAAARIRAREGDVPGAMEDYAAIVKLGENLSGTPHVLSQVSRAALLATVFDDVGNTIPPGRLTPEQARAFVVRLDVPYHREEYAKALTVDTAACYSMSEEINEGDCFPWSGKLRPRFAAFWERLYQTPVGGAMLASERQSYTDYIDRYIQAMRLPYFEAKPELDAIDSELDTLPRWKILTRLFVYQTKDSSLVQALREARLDLMRIGLLLEAHCDEAGAYPETLDVLAPELGGSVPVDPFTGNPYVYVPEGGTFLLYSAGKNQQDDGGRYSQADGDIVWRGVEVSRSPSVE